jgi:hypothetical protein
MDYYHRSSTDTPDSSSEPLIPPSTEPEEKADTSPAIRERL